MFCRQCTFREEKRSIQSAGHRLYHLNRHFDCVAKDLSKKLWLGATIMHCRSQEHAWGIRHEQPIAGLGRSAPQWYALPAHRGAQTAQKDWESIRPGHAFCWPNWERCNSSTVQPLLPVSILSADPLLLPTHPFEVHYRASRSLSGLWESSNSDPDSLDRAAHTWAPQPSTCAGRPIGRLGDSDWYRAGLGWNVTHDFPSAPNSQPPSSNRKRRNKNTLL